eukprot:5800925-Prymnesium_polylepis.1
MEDEKPKRISEEIGAGLAELPVFQLNNLIDELGRSDDEGMDDELENVTVSTMITQPNPALETTGVRAAADFI